MDTPYEPPLVGPAKTRRISALAKETKAQADLERAITERIKAENAKTAPLPPAGPIMPPDTVMAKLSAVADHEDPRYALPALIELSRVYTLAKRDHGADSRVDRLSSLANASDDDLDSALNRGIVGQ